MSDDPRLTPAQQAAAVDRIGDNIALTSGAGCGKTFVLARRFTELLLAADGEDDPLSRFVALTFTEKAALEMRNRVRGILTNLAGGAKGADRNRLLDWLEELPEARISTIHSFCSSILRTYAIAAGIDPNFSVCADDQLTDQMISEAADEALLAAVEARRSDVAEMLTTLSFDALVKMVSRLIERRNAIDASEYLDAGETLRRWARQLDIQRAAAVRELCDDDAICHELDALAAVACSNPDDKLAIYRQEQLQLIGDMLRDPDAITLEMFGGLKSPGGGIGSAKAWGDKEVVKDTRQRIAALVSSIREEYEVYFRSLGELDGQAAQQLATLAQLAMDAEDIYARAKRGRGMLDFDDLLSHTNRLLADNDDIRRRITEQIDQLLIDECQDTNAFQVSLLTRLLFGAPLLPAPLPEGRLFVVGDAKQSIYRFRGAQVEVFNDLCRSLPRGAREDLDLSFRTHSAGLAFINELFGKLMGGEYEPIRAHRSETPPQPAVEIILAAGDDTHPVDSADAAVRAQAAVTADRIAEMLRRGEQIAWDKSSARWRVVQPGDIAILLGRMTRSTDFQRELARRGVPFYVVAGRGFFQQQEVFDILNALRVIDNPLDDVALFGVLRSAMFSLDDNALMLMAEELEPPYFPKLAGFELPKRLDPLARDGLKLATELLGKLHRRKDAVGADSLVDELLWETGYQAALAAQFQGKRMLGNVRMLQDMARSASGGGMVLADFITQMSERVLAEYRSAQAAVAGEAENVVRLMTVHKAKGLEFPVVFLPDLNARREGAKGPLLHRAGWGLTCGFKSDDDELPVSYQIARLAEDRDQRAEDIRRFYVAATRHQDHLVFVGADYRKKDKKTGEAGPFSASDSFLARMDDALDLRGLLDQGNGDLPYNGGKHHALLRRLTPSHGGADRKTSAGRAMLEVSSSPQDLSRRILESAAGGDAATLLGPLDASIGRAELAVTALSEFEQCEMMYRWRYELRIPPEAIRRNRSRSNGPAVRGGTRLDPATLGTIFHRCMELLDFSSSAGAEQQAGSLVARVLAAEELDDVADAEAIASDLRAMLISMHNGDLWRQIASSASIFRELDFSMDIAHGRLRGQIDLLFEDAGGWHIVDYKSDRTSTDDIPAHSLRYELQMLLYAVAAQRYLGSPPADATLYFLRSGQTHTFPIGADVLQSARRRAENLVRKLITARRSGRFAHVESKMCPHCPYAALCVSES